MTWTGTGVAESTVANGSLRPLLLGVRPVLLTRVDGSLYAIEGACPHLGGELADGTIVGRRLTCPLHEAVFDVATGAVVADPFGVAPPEGGVAPVAAYAVRVTNGMIEVDLPEAGPG